MYRPPLPSTQGRGGGVCAQTSLRAVTFSFWPYLLYSFLSISPANTAVSGAKRGETAVFAGYFQYEGNIREPTAVMLLEKGRLGKFHWRGLL